MKQAMKRECKGELLENVGEFGPAIKRERTARGWTQDYLAGQLGVTKGYICRLEAGKARPAAGMVKRLAAAYRTEASSLLILAGHVPAELQEILVRHPEAALAVLKQALGEGGAATGVAQGTSDRSPRDQPLLGITPPASYDLVRSDCFEWLAQRRPNSIHAIVTDPPYGLREYTQEEKAKLRSGKGGVWRIPPSLDGCERSPLPRFTVLGGKEKRQLGHFFLSWARAALRVLVPGGHVFIATNPLLSQIVYVALIEAGFEKRGEIIRLVQTLRGGDRPKNAHVEFEDVTVMPRSCWEP
ncbi:helix-turn-helix domain-containing protein, partial [bacterium]|nr:helix-turn-helix domain-containing protein [bacterium]